MNKLLNCPLCGSEADIEYNEVDDEWTIYCTNAYCNLTLQPIDCKTEKEIIELWNTRLLIPDTVFVVHDMAGSVPDQECKTRENAESYVRYLTQWLPNARPIIQPTKK